MKHLEYLEGLEMKCVPEGPLKMEEASQGEWGPPKGLS